jgi:GPH family glycoside/pentoside/hexuronide:cation symporter
MNILWRPLVQKIGPRKSWLISLIIFIAMILPLMFIQDAISGLIVFFLIGIGLSGSIYIVDIVISDIIDEDEVRTGARREGGYYGVNMFLMRLSAVLVFLSISLVFTNVGWAVYEPEKVTSEIIFGLRVLMFVFPAIALTVAILVLYKYPLDNERLREVKDKLQKIHKDKKSKI